MKDQAEKLRMMIQNEHKAKAKTLAVVSGKGGVGKSNISINLAILLQKKGKRVLLFDLDIGMGNVNIILGSSSSLSLYDYLQTDMPITDVIYKTAGGISYISAGNGLNEAVYLDDYMLSKLLQGLNELQHNYDYIIFDMAAGATTPTLKILLSADEIFVIATPEPTSITDAYSMMKFICLEGASSQFLLICNRADNHRQGMDTLHRLKQTAKKFLNKEVELLGVLPEDNHVKKAVISQTAFTIKYPNSPIAVRLEKLLDQYLTNKPIDHVDQNTTFISKLRQFLTREIKR